MRWYTLPTTWCLMFTLLLLLILCVFSYCSMDHIQNDIHLDWFHGRFLMVLVFVIFLDIPNKTKSKIKHFQPAYIWTRMAGLSEWTVCKTFWNNIFCILIQKETFQNVVLVSGVFLQNNNLYETKYTIK